MFITKCVFYESNRYQQQYNRPYQTRVTKDDIDELASATDYGTVFTSTALGRASASVMQPSSEAQNKLSIENGWETQRLCFMIEIEHENFGSNRHVQILTGYTNHLGYTSSGAIDPNMRLYINNTISIRSTPAIDRDGRPYTNVSVTDSSQVLSGSWAEPTSVANSTAINTMRPTDIMSTISLENVIGARANASSNIVRDFRTGMVNEPRLSRRSNNNGSSYLSRTLEAHRSATLAADQLEKSYGSVISSTRAALREVDLKSNVGLGILNETTGFSEDQWVSWRELLQFNPRLEDDQYTTIARRESMIDQTTHRFDVDGLSTADTIGISNENIGAQLTYNTVPALMSDSIITKFVFMATNDVTPDSPFPYQVNIDDMRSFSNVLDMRRQAEIMKFRIGQELMPALTQHNRRLVTVWGYIDLVTDAYIDISMDGGYEHKYCFPAFSDAMAAPIITTDRNSLVRMANDIENIVGNINYGNY